MGKKGHPKPTILLRMSFKAFQSVIKKIDFNEREWTFHEVSKDIHDVPNTF